MDRIGNFTFGFCRSLGSITIPSGVKRIDDFAFVHCDRLVNMDIPSNVTDIGDYAFGYCGNLSRINLPVGLKSIGDNTFWECRSLTIYGDGNAYVKSYANSKNIPFVGSGFTSDGTDNSSGGTDKPATVRKNNKLTVKRQTYTLTASPKQQTIASLGARAVGGTITYRSNNKNVTVSSKGKVTVAKNFTGTAKITVTAGSSSYQTATAVVTVKVAKAAQKFTKAVTKKSVKKSIKKQSFNIHAKAAWKVTYAVVKKDSRKVLTVNKAGKVTIKKNAKAGKYTIKVIATALPKGIYKKTSKLYTIKVTVKGKR